MSLRALSLAAFMAIGLSSPARKGGGDDRASLSVSCSRSSAFVQVHVAHARKLGKLVMEVRSQQGRVLYREEGKAFSGELVRRLDKGQLPRGTHTLSITSRELSLSQAFTVE